MEWFSEEMVRYREVSASLKVLLEKLIEPFWLMRDALVLAGEAQALSSLELEVERAC